MRPFPAPPTKIVIHCTGTPNGKHVSIDTIRREHMTRKPKPFSDIGYHWVILSDGSIAPGRPELFTGAHVPPELHTPPINSCSIAIAMVGTDKFSEKQWWALHVKTIDVESRFPIEEITGHREFSPDLDHDNKVEPHEWVKLCPGFSVAEWLESGMRPLPNHTL